MKKPGVRDIIESLNKRANPRNVEGMARYGITSAKALGVPAPFIRELGKKIGRNHRLALDLWTTGILEARAVAALIADPSKVTKSLMNSWVKDFDNWAVCDGACSILFDKTRYAEDVALKWTTRKEEYVKRAGFVIMAGLAVHDKQAPDSEFLKFLPVIKRGAVDDRNFVKKAVNWALRQIGKRNLKLNAAAIRTANEIRKMDSRSARWIAADALRELKSAGVRNRFLKKANRKSTH
ncbi:MAG TPA: DNA alkylation repair protein [Bacteroidota bacterium]